MDCKVKKFGKGGLHVVIKKSSGYKEGDTFTIPDKNATEKPLTKRDVEDIVDRKLDDLKNSRY